MINFKTFKNPLCVFVLLCTFFACDSTEPILEAKKQLTQSQLASIVNAMPDYIRIVELTNQHQEAVSRRLSTLSDVQKNKLKFLFITYTTSGDFLTEASKEELQLFEELSNTIYGDELRIKKSIFINKLSQQYRFSYQDLFLIFNSDIDLNSIKNGRTKMPCSEVYNQIYWQIVEDMYTFAEQNQSIPDAVAIDRAAGYAADYAYIGCLMAGQ